MNLAFVFAAILAGAVLMDYGVKSARAAFASSPAGASSSTPSGSIPAGGSQSQTIKAAAAKWGIPDTILWGVYGIETAFGKDVTTSSAGAEGSFQFIRSTAASYGYPYSNATDPTTFAAQADGAAHYLHDLYQQSGGDWNKALQGYSGGGYGLAEVLAKAGQG